MIPGASRWTALSSTARVSSSSAPGHQRRDPLGFGRFSPSRHDPSSGGGISGTQAEAILRELREIRSLVQKQQPAAKPAVPAAPRTVTVPLGDSPAPGQASAPVVLVEFTDFQYPYCKRAHDEVLAALKKKYVDTGKVRMVSRNLPLPFQPNAGPAALAALCAGEQGQFWAMRDRLFVNTEALSRPDFLKAAGELKLDVQAFTACLDVWMRSGLCRRSRAGQAGRRRRGDQGHADVCDRARRR